MRKRRNGRSEIISLEGASSMKSSSMVGQDGRAIKLVQKRLSEVTYIMKKTKKPV